MVETIERVRTHLARHEGARIDGADREASVAIVFRQSRERELELLFIERARQDRDPWSGQMAFPGGRRDPEDEDLAATARRETLEETGVDLSGAESLGRISDLSGRRAGQAAQMRIAAFVFHLQGPRPPLEIDRTEVETAFWVPVGWLADKDRFLRYSWPPAPGTSFQGVVVGDPERHIVWGLTFRFLERLFEALGGEFPPRGAFP